MKSLDLSQEGNCLSVLNVESLSLRLKKRKKRKLEEVVVGWTCCKCC